MKKLEERNSVEVEVYDTASGHGSGGSFYNINSALVHAKNLLKNKDKDDAEFAGETTMIGVYDYDAEEGYIVYIDPSYVKRMSQRDFSDKASYEIYMKAAKENMRTGKPVKYSYSMQEAVYSLGAGGMKKIGDETIHIQPDMVYFMGASASPEMIFVTDVKNDMIFYRHHPFTGRDLRIELNIGKNLIQQATQRRYNSFRGSNDPITKAWKDLLDGKPSNLKLDIEDYQPVEVIVTPTGKDMEKDMWYAAEEYGGVGGRENKNSPNGLDYIINTDGGRLKKLKKDRRFKVKSTRKTKESFHRDYKKLF